VGEAGRAALTNCESWLTWAERDEKVDSVFASREERARYIGDVSQSRSRSGG